MPSDKFVNPYTFIGLGDWKSEGTGKGQLTGVLKCNLKTLTPLIIPSAANEDAFSKFADELVCKWNKEKKSTDKEVDRKKVRSYDFYSYDNPEDDREKVSPSSPVIPGSSIRGMIRSIYEALTDSCLSTIDDDTVLNKRSVIPYDRERKSDNMGVGIVEKIDGKWFLKKGKKALMPVFGEGFTSATNKATGEKFKRIGREKYPGWGREMYVLFGGMYGKAKHLEYPVISSAEKSRTRQDEIPAYHLPGVRFGDTTKKHFDTVVYGYESDKTPYKLSPDDINRATKIASLYKANAKNPNMPPYDGWANIEADKPFPVYFEKLGNVYYISPACISQEVFARKVSEIVGDFAPCKNSASLCDACNLFGMVGKDDDDSEGSGNVNALASRVSFRDATSLQENDWYENEGKPIRLAILGQPRPSATEFYMNKIEGADYYNYDYKITHGAGKNKKEVLSAEAVSIKGRKFYWHSKDTQVANPTDRPDMTVISRAVKAEHSFTFDVAFENVTEDELAKLIWVLTIGGKASGDAPSHGFKLGHGKPIGYGSVGISIDYDKSGVYKIDDSLNISLHPLPSKDITASLTHTNEFMRVSNWIGKHENVMYPKSGPKGSESVFAWFQANRRGRGNDFTQQFIKTLPDLSDAEHDQNLPRNPHNQ
ncbi:MAG: TIGR03986 family CRISPR-associated RAMP protein [Defluviitaleaceae bacterium]|nr:TIGR03986 family CRISPR-associated RAMP protein [Defluviitaleaceae bacterium]